MICDPRNDEGAAPVPGKGHPLPATQPMSLCVAQAALAACAGPFMAAIGPACKRERGLTWRCRRCAQVVTGSSDSTVRVWDAKTCDCLTSFRPPQGTAGGERAVLDVQLNPQNVDQLLVCTRSPTLFTMTLQGQARCAPLRRRAQGPSPCITQHAGGVPCISMRDRVPLHHLPCFPEVSSTCAGLLMAKASP